MLHIDGSKGEGGGQVLRTSLALSLVTGTPFRMTNIRAGRSRPGLLRQHLTAVGAAEAVGGAEVSGAELGSQELTFRPGQVRAGDYHFAVGTAGSATLVLQTVLPPLLFTPGESTLLLEGGTHNPAAPPYDYLERVYLPLLRRMGPRVDTTLERPGFYPAGGGRFRAAITPAPLKPIELLERGEVVRRSVRAAVSRFPIHIAEREAVTARALLGWPPEEASAETWEGSPGPGNVVAVEVESEHVTERFTAFGEKRVSAEQVATRAAEEARRYLSAGVPVGEHLCDQLLLLCALARGGTFRTLPLDGHSVTQVEIFAHFLDVKVRVEEIGPEVREVQVG